LANARRRCPGAGPKPPFATTVPYHCLLHSPQTMNEGGHVPKSPVLGERPE
jgi:hypothetical protein